MSKVIVYIPNKKDLTFPLLVKNTYDKNIFICHEGNEKLLISHVHVDEWGNFKSEERNLNVGMYPEQYEILPEGSSITITQSYEK